jgi:hypothetical protein
MAFVIGGGAAALLLLFELVVAQSFSISFQGVPWWFLRLCIEGAQGALAVLIVKGAALQFASLDDPVYWVLAGLFAPSIIRQIQWGSPGANGFAFDVQDLVDRLTYRIDDRLDGASAQKQSAENRKLVDRLMAGGVSAEELAEEVLAVIRGRKALETRAKDAEYIREMTRSDELERTKLRLIVERARSMGIIGAAKRLARARHR